MKRKSQKFPMITSGHIRVDSSSVYPLRSIYRKKLTANNKSSAVHTIPD